MKLIIGCVFAALLCGVTYRVNAQVKRPDIKGNVALDNMPLPEAINVFLLKVTDSAVVKTTATNRSGNFEFLSPDAGNYLIKVTKVGYANIIYGPIQFSGLKNIIVPTIILKPVVKELNAVAITAQRDYLEIKSEKTVLNVAQNIGAAGNSVYDILKAAPGVRVNNDQILYKAGQKPLIAINGKPVNMPDDQLANLLKNYQSSMISQIELIPNPSGKYDAASAGGVINIILKKSKNLGTNASVSQSAAYGEVYKFTTSVNLNIRTKKLNIFTSYTFGDNKLNRTFSNSRDIQDNMQVDNFNLNYKGVTKAVNNAFNIGTDYLITANQTLGVLVGGYRNSNNIAKSSTTDVLTNNKLDSVINTRSVINRDFSTVNYNLNYRGSFGKKNQSTISANADYSDYNRKSMEFLDNITDDPAGRRLGDTVFYKDRSPSHIQIWSERLDFSRVLSKNSSIDAGIKNNQITSDNQINFDQLISGAYQSIPSLTDHFIYHEHVYAGYVVYNLKAGGTAYRFSLRGEQTHSDALSINPNRETNQTYFDLFPNVQLSRKLNDNNQLTFVYARNINRPNYQDLNPFVGYVDQFYYSTGNPFLKPQLINKFEFADFFMHKFRAAVGVVITNDFSNTIFQQNDTTKVYTTTKSNIANRYQYTFSLDAPLDLTNWWKADITLFDSYEKYFYYNHAGVKTAYDMSVDVTQDFKITNKLSAQVKGFYEIPTYFAISQYRAYYYVDGGFSYAILAGNGSIKLYATDIFKTNQYAYHTNFSNLDLTQRERNAVRFVTATFSYNFGNLLLKAARRTRLSPEQVRLEAGGEN